MTRRATLGIWSLAIAAGVVPAFAYRWTANPDVVSYIDVAQEWMRRPSLHAVSTYWSPLFSWMLALAATVTHTTPLYWLAIGHGVSAICFVGTLVSAAALSRRVSAEQSRDTSLLAAALAAVALAGTVSIDPELITPDILLCCMTVLASCFAIDVITAPQRTTPAVKLGLVLGIAYLAKAIALYIAGATFAVLVVAGLLERRRVVRPILIALGGFVVVASPWVAMQSRVIGALTIGSAGGVVYAQEVLSVPRLGSLMPRDGVTTGVALANGARLVGVSPWLVRADSTVPGASPFQYDIYRWHESDARPRIDVAAIWRKFLDQLLGCWPPFALALAVIGVLVARGRGAVPPRTWSVLIILGAPLFVVGGLYLLILSEPRYLAPLWLPFAIIAPALLASSQREAGDAGASRAWILASLIGFASGACPALLRNSTYAIAGARGVDLVPESVQPQLAFLRRSGLVSGEQVALIGDPYEVAWAVPLGVRVSLITPGLERGELFVAMSDGERAALLRTLRTEGIRHLIIRLPVTRDVAGMQTDELAELGVVVVP